MTFPDELAPKQITNLQNTTARQQNSAKTFIKRPGEGNEKVFQKSQIGWRQMLVLSLPSRNNFLVIAVKNYTL